MQKTSCHPIIILMLIATFAYNQEENLLIKNINYIDVIAGKAYKGDILIENGKIAEVIKEPNILTATTSINGEGKWAIPGLVDAHIHLFQSGGIYTRPDVLDLREFKAYATEREWLKNNTGDILKRYLQCGITTVIDLGGPLYNFDLRDKYDDSTEYPNLYLTGPLVSTYQPEAFKIEDPPIVRVNSKEEAIALVQKQIPYDPDFIKIWYIALPTQTAESTYDIVEATIEESHRHGLKVAVHATQLNTAKLAIKAGADILVHSVDDPVDEDFIKMMKENEVVYIPTLVVHGNYVETFGQEPSLTMEDFTRSHPIPLGSFMDPKHFPEGNIFEQLNSRLPQINERVQNQDSIRAENLDRINKTSLIIATGTDAGNIGTLHASSFYDEIAAMQKAGMSNMDILSASTINGAKVLGKEHEFGSIEKGKFADLLILNSNPMHEIEAIKDIQYVVKGGKLYSADTIVRETSENLVQQQVNGYNAGNIDAFLAPYSDSVEIYNFPSDMTAKGKENIRGRYEEMFAQLPELHCEIVNRTVMGKTVIDHERITGIPNRESIEAIAIYKIEDHKIAEVYFIHKERD